MDAASDLTPVFRSLADPTRRRIYEQVVRARETSVSALVAGATISQPAVSQHLKALRETGLVEERRDGRFILYRPSAQGLAPLVDWLDHYGAFWRDRFADLHRVLKEIDHDHDSDRP